MTGKYNSCAVFRSITEARKYPHCQVIKTLDRIVFDDGEYIPKGTIIEYLDVTWDDKQDFVLSPFYGVGYYRIVDRRKAIVIQ